MQSNYYSTYSCINIYERPSIKAKISSQIIYGEKFKILKKIKSFLKIKTSYDKVSEGKTLKEDEMILKQHENLEIDILN